MQPFFIVALMAALSLALPVTIDCMGDDDDFFEETMVKICEMATNGSESFLASEAYIYETNDRTPSNETQEIARLLSTVRNHLKSFVNETDFIGERFDGGLETLEIEIKQLDDALKAIDGEYWPVGVLEDWESLQELIGFMKATAIALEDLRNTHSSGLKLMRKAVNIDINSWVIRSAVRAFTEETAQLFVLWARLKSLLPEIKAATGVNRSLKHLLKAEFRFAAKTLNPYAVSRTRASKGRKTSRRPITRNRQG